MTAVGVLGLALTGSLGSRPALGQPGLGWVLWGGGASRGVWAGMTAGMMGGGPAAWRTGRLVDRAGLQNLVREGEAGVQINRKTNTVRYPGRSAMIVALASPHGKPDMTWEIDGLVNPTLVVRAGARLTVTLVNADWGYLHGFELTPTPPPYPFMAMMSSATWFVVPPLPERTTKSLTTARYYSQSAALTVRSGVYYYLCPVPGHAQQGMYGRLVVTA